MGDDDMDHEIKTDAMEQDAGAANDRDSDDDDDRRPARAARNESPARSRSRSRSRQRSRSRSRERERDTAKQRPREPRRERNDRYTGLPTETMPIGSEDAAFLVGAGGSTKRKVARVANCRFELLDEEGGGHRLEITGDDASRKRAKEYVDWVLKQRVGPIVVDTSAPRDDLSVVPVPEDCVAYVMGKNGCVLRAIEEDWSTLMFFGKPTVGAQEGKEMLMILGSRRGRRGAELKVMSAVEHKLKGYYVDGDKKLKERLNQVGDGEGDGWGYDVFPFEGDEFSYALGAQGSTRKKLAAASGAILEYVGPVAIMAGNRDERQRCWDYLNWLLKQRRGPLSVSPKGRDDVTELKIPRGSAGRLQGHRAENLRSIERETSTFCFITEAKDVDVDDRDELMLIFGADRNKRFKALDLMEDAMAGRYRPVPADGRGGGRGGGRAAGMCFDYQRGRCSRGSSCRFSHDDRDGGRGGGGGGGGPDRGGRRDRRDDRPYGRGRDRSRDDRGRGRSPRDDRYDRR